MEARLWISVLGLAFIPEGYGAGQEQVETEEAVVPDTPSTGRSSGGLFGGVGAGRGMAPGMVSAEWRKHMAVTHAAAGDTLPAMTPMHQQVVTRMVWMTDGRMGMAMDGASVATRDSLGRDLDRMQIMTLEEREAFLEEDAPRMQRIFRMHQTAPEPTPPQQ